MAIDGYPVSEEGEVTFRNHERVAFSYLITRKKVGDKLALSLLRSAHAPATPAEPFDINKLAEKPGKPTPLELTVTLAPTHELVPRELHKDYTPAYCIVGGLVFVVAGLPLLTQACEVKHWQMYDAVYALLAPEPAARDDKDAKAASSGAAQTEDASKAADAQALLCSNCLAHEVNESFRRFVGERLHKVNGVAVRNMAHCVALLAPLLDASATPPPRSHVVLQFHRPRASAVFETAALRAATPIIQEAHKVPRWTNADMASATPEVVPAA